MYEKIKKCCDQIREKTNFKPKLAIVLGSGLGDFVNNIDIKATVNYSEIDGLPTSTVSGHCGRFIFGYLSGMPIVAMQGRVHYYEGYDMADVVLPIRVMRMLGAEILILTNAAGGINKKLSEGAFMLIKGHISSFVPSALRGKNIDELGVRFPDMSEVYDKELCKIILSTAQDLKINITEGVYLQTSGPNFETPEEIKMYSLLGADAVGMSTACEAMAARHMGMRVCGISCVTNMAAGISKSMLSHEEVKQTADRVSSQFNALLSDVVKNIACKI